jgi:hypothetical protein
MTEINETSVPVDAFLRAFPIWTAVAGFFATIVPSIFIVLLGVSVIAKRVVFNAATVWSLFVLFFVSVAVLGVSIPKIVFSFKQDAEYKVENVYKLNGKTAVLKLNETGMDDYHAVRLDLEGYDGQDIKLVQTFEAQGSSRAKAIENARMVEYNVIFRDTTFTFDSNLKFKENAVFRAQRLNMTMYIPFNTPFTMDEGVSRFINEYVDPEKRDRETWTMTEDGLKCASCPPEDKSKITDLRDFNEIEINGKFDLRVVSGHEYSVELTGPERSKEKYHVERKGNTLIIDFEGKKKFDWKLRDLNLEEVEITVTMPEIEKIEAVGIGTIRLDEFHTNDLDIDLRGPVKLRAELNSNDLSVTLSGSAEADLSGKTNNMNATVELASKLRAYNLEAMNAFVETSGASSAKVNVSGTLEMEEGVASKIDFRGNAHVIKRD